MPPPSQNVDVAIFGPPKLTGRAGEIREREPLITGSGRVLTYCATPPKTGFEKGSKQHTQLDDRRQFFSHHHHHRHHHAWSCLTMEEPLLRAPCSHHLESEDQKYE